MRQYHVLSESPDYLGSTLVAAIGTHSLTWWCSGCDMVDRLKAVGSIPFTMHPSPIPTPLAPNDVDRRRSNRSSAPPNLAIRRHNMDYFPLTSHAFYTPTNLLRVSLTLPVLLYRT